MDGLPTEFTSGLPKEFTTPPSGMLPPEFSLQQDEEEIPAPPEPQFADLPGIGRVELVDQEGLMSPAGKLVNAITRGGAKAAAGFWDTAAKLAEQETGEKYPHPVQKKFIQGVKNFTSRMAKNSAGWVTEGTVPTHEFGTSLVEGLAEAGMMTGEIMALSVATHSPTVAMTALGAAEGKANTNTIGGTIKGAASGWLMGVVFHSTSYLPKIYALPTTGLIFGGLKAQELASKEGSLAALTPDEKQEVLVSTLVGSLMSTFGKQRDIREVTVPLQEKLLKFREKMIGRGFEEPVVDQALGRFQDIVGTEKGVEEVFKFVDSIEKAKEPTPIVPPVSEAKQAVTQEQSKEATPGKGASKKEKATPATEVAFDLQSQAAELSKPVFVPAVKDASSGKVFIGKPGEIHGDVMNQVPNGLMNLEDGFVDAKTNKYYTREEALIKISGAKTVKEIREIKEGYGGLDTGDLDNPYLTGKVVQPKESRVDINKELRDKTQAIIDRAKNLNKTVDKEMRASAVEQAQKEIVDESRRTPEEIAAIEALPAPVFERTSHDISIELDKVDARVESMKAKLPTMLDERGIVKEEFEKEFDIFKRGISAFEEKSRRLREELIISRLDDIKEVGPIDESKLPELADFIVPEEARAVVAGELNPVTGQVTIAKDALMKNAAKITEQKQAFQDVRKGAKAAYRFKDGNVISGETHSSLTGELLNYKGDASNAEAGWLKADGTFIPEGMLKPGPIDDVKIIKGESTSTIAWVADKFKNSKGVAEDPNTVILDPEQMKYVQRLRDATKAIVRNATAAGKDLRTYMEEMGLSNDAIDTINKAIKLDIQISEVIAYPTNRQKILAHDLAKALGVDLDSVKDSIGLSGKTMGKSTKAERMTYEEAEKTISVLKSMVAAKNPQDPMDADTIVNLLKNDEIPPVPGLSNAEVSLRWKLSTFANSPKVVFRRTPIGQEFYTMWDRAFQRIEMAVEQITGKYGYNIAKYEKLMRTGLESDKNIALALENKIDIKSLPKDQQVAIQANKDAYKYMMDSYVKAYVPDPAREVIVRELARKVKYTHNENAEKVKSILSDMQRMYGLSKKELTVIDVLRAEEQFYLPHVHDKDALKQVAIDSLDRMRRQGSDNVKKMDELQDIIDKFNGGSLVLYSDIPNSLRMDYFKKRHGMEGYKISSGVAFNTYLHQWTRKVYLEPALQESLPLYRQMDNEMKRYARYIMLDALGRLDRPAVKLSNGIKGFEWVRTLGFNIASAAYDATQVINILGKGDIDTFTGAKRALSPEGYAAYRQSGIATEIPGKMYSGESMTGGLMEKAGKIRKYSSIFWDAVEGGLHNLGFNTGLAKAQRIGLKGEDAFWYAVDFDHSVNFRYGKMGMPKMMRGWGGVFTQFSSYPLKQWEFIYDLIRDDAKEGNVTKGLARFLGYFALAYGTRDLTRKYLGVDLGNALGIGVDIGELYQSLSSLTREEWEDAGKHMKLAFRTEGSGILPQGTFPLTGPFMKLMQVVAGKDAKINDVLRELEPTVARRVMNLYYALKYGKGDRFPVFKYNLTEAYTGVQPRERMYELSLKDTLIKFVSKSATENTEQIKNLRKSMDKKMAADILESFRRALVTGDSKEINRIFTKYPGVVIQDNIFNDLYKGMLKFELTRESREAMNPPGLGEMMKEQAVAD